MRRKLLAAIVAMALAVGMTGVANATKPDPNHKVTICHRTNSTHNPYVKITVDEASVNKDTGDDKGQGDHNAEHNGPVWNASMPNGGDWGDIIPPFYANGDGGYWPSKNWTADGIAIFNNGCNPVPVQHNPSLDAEVSCDAEAAEYTIKYTGNTDGADSTVPDLPVIHKVSGKVTHDSATVNFKYSDGPDVLITKHVDLKGDCFKEEPTNHDPSLQAEAVCNILDQVYVVTYTGDTDGAINTVPDLPVVHEVPGYEKSDSATVVFKYDNGNITLTKHVELDGTCYTDVKPDREHNHHRHNGGTNVKGGFAYTL